MDNDILGLNQKPIEAKPNQFGEVNFETINAKSAFQQDAEQAQSLAMENHIAGIPIIDTKIKVAQNKPPTTEFVSSRDEVMSQLNMIDENFNYTDTYTNYINQGGTPLPGYEHLHQPLLEQERKEVLFQKVEDGYMSFDNALMEAYGKDIMATMNMDVTSVAYWQNKFQSNDFSNPFTNHYLMDQVRAIALEQYNADVMGRMSTQQANQASHLSSLVGDELTGKQIKDIFGDIGTIAEDQNMTDSEVREACLSGRFATESRIIWTGDNEGFYLHTDGQLHHLTAENIRRNEKGEITDISLNGSEFIDVGRHFVSGVSSVFTGLVKMGTLITAVDGIWNGDGYIQNLTEDLAAVDAFINDSSVLHALTDTGHIDMDGFKVSDVSDWANLLADIGGTIAGGYLLTAGAGVLTSAGGKLAQSSNLLAKGSGHIIQGVGNLAARSTGMYAGAKDFNAHSFRMLFGAVNYTGKGAAALNHVFKTCTTYAIKDFYTSVQQMSTAKWQAQNGALTQEDYNDIFKRAAGIASLNLVVSAIFAGGINDNQLQRMKNAAGLKTGEQKAVDKIVKELGTVNEITKDFAKNNLITKELIDKVSDSSLREFLKARRCRIAFNTAFDFVDNFVTMTSQDLLTHVDSKTGDIVALEDALKHDPENGKDLWGSILLKNLVQATVMTGPTLKGNLEAHDYNVATGTLKSAFQKLTSDLDKKISATSNPQDKQTLTLLKENIIGVYKSTKGTAEEKILTAFDKTHEMLKDDKGKSIVIDSITSAVDEKKRTFYRELHKQAYNTAVLNNKVYDNFYKGSDTKDRKLLRKIVTFIPRTVLKSWAGIEDGTLRSSYNSSLKEMDVDFLSLKFTAEMNKEYATTGEVFDVLTGSVNSSRALDKLGEVDLKLDESIELIHPIEVADLKDLPIPEGEDKVTFLGTHTIVRIKNEASIKGSDALNARLKGNIVKTSLDIIAENTGNTLVRKINDDYYAFTNLTNGMEKVFTGDTILKLNAGLANLALGKYEGLEVMLATILGDEHLNKVEGKDIKAADTLNDILSKAIDNKVLDEGTVVSLMDNLLVQEDLPKGVKEAVEVFRTMITNVTESKYDQMTLAEKYYYVYKSSQEILKAHKDNPKAISSDATNKLINMFIDISDENNPTIKADIAGMLKTLIAEEKLSAKDVEVLLTICKEGLNSVPTLSEAVERVFKAVSQKIPYSEATEDVYIKALLGTKYDEEIEKLQQDVTKYEQKYKNAKQGSKAEEINQIKYEKAQKELNAKINYYNTMRELIKTAYKTIIEINKRTEDKDLGDNLVVLNGAKLLNPELKAIAHEEGRSVQSEKAFMLPKALENILKKHSDIFSTQIKVLDLDDARDVEILRNILVDLKLVDKDTDLSTPDKIKRAIEIINNPDIIFSSGKKSILKGFKNINNDAIAKKVLENIRNLKDKKYIVQSNGNMVELDVYNTIRNSVDLSNLSDEAISTLVRTEDAKIYTFEDFDLQDFLDNPGRYIYTSKETEDEAVKAGTPGSQAIKNELEFKQTIAKEINQDKDLAMKFALLQIVNKLEADSKGLYKFIVPYSEEVMNIAKDFYATEKIADGKVTLIFDPSKADDLRKYITTSKEINLFKIIPVITTEHSNNLQQYIEQFKIREYNGKEVFKPEVFDGNSGVHQGLDELLNIRFSWDIDNRIKTEIFLGLFAKANEGDFNYNVYSADNTAKTFDGSYEDYVQKILKNEVVDTEHPVGKLLSMYDKYLPLLLKGSGEGDHTLWMLEPSVLKYINDVYVKKGIEGVKSLTPQNIKDIYRAVKISKYNKQSEAGLIDTPVILNTGRYDNVPMSADILLEATGKTFELMDSTGKFYKDESLIDADIAKALNEINTLIENYEAGFTAQPTKYITMYKDSYNMNFAASVAGHHGYVTIEDLDYIIDMDFAFFKKLYSNTGFKEPELRRTFDSLKKLASKLLGIHNTKRVIMLNSKSAGSSEGASFSLTPMANKNEPTSAQEAGKQFLTLLNNKADYERDTDRLKRLTDFNVQDLNYLERTQLEDLDNKITTEYFSLSDREVLNISNNIGKQAQYQIVKNTANSLENMFYEIGKEIDKENYFVLSKEMLDAVGGNKGESMGIFVINPEDGKIIAKIPKAKNNFLEIHSALSKLDNLEGKLVISMDNHNLRSNDGIKFVYKYLDSPKAIEDLRTAYLENGIAAAWKVRNKKIHGDKSLEEYMKYLKNIPEEELMIILNNAERRQMSKKATNEFIVSVVSALTNNENADYIATAILERRLGNPLYRDNSKNNYLNRKSNDLNSDNGYEREQAGLAIYGQTYYSLTDGLREVLEDINNHYINKVTDEEAKEYGRKLASTVKGSKEFKDVLIEFWNAKKEGKEEFKLSYDSIVSLLTSYIANSNSAQSISLKTNLTLTLDKLVNTPKEYNKITIRDWDEQTKLTPQELKDIFENKSSVTLKEIDAEGFILPGERKPNSIEEAFQLAIKTYENGEQVTKVYFIKHGDLSPDALDKKYEVTKSDFHKENQGYRNAWEEYKKAYDTGADNLIDAQDVYKLFKTGDIVLAFNGFNYDFNLLKDTLNDNEVYVKYYDVLSLAAALDDNATTHKVSQEALAKKYLEVMDKHDNAHNAFDDVNVMDDIVKVLVDNCLAFDMEGKNTIVKDINEVANLLGVKDEELPQLYKDLDNIFKDPKDSPDIIRKQRLFKQDFMDTSDTFKILRLLNFLERNYIGTVIKDFENHEMYRQFNVDAFVENFIKGGADNIVTALAHIRLSDKTSTASAFEKLLHIGYSTLDKDKRTVKNVIEVLNSKEILNKLPEGIDYSTEEFKSLKNSIEKNLSKEIFSAIQDKDNGLGLNAQDIRNWRKTGNIDTFIRGLDQVVRDLNLDTNIKDLVVANLLTPTTSTNGSIEDYQEPRVAVASNKFFDSIKASTEKYNASETLLIEPLEAQYNMIAPVNTDSDLTEYYKTSRGEIAKRKAENIEASDIVLTREAAENVFGRNIETILDENGEAWVYSLAYPSDKANALMAHRLRIIEGTGIRIFLTPITQKILRARDFDGDFITVWGGLTTKQKDIAKEQLKYAYRQYTLQEKLYDFVKGLERKDAPHSKAIDAYQIGSTKKVLEQSYVVDALIGKRIKAYKDPVKNSDLIAALTESIRKESARLNDVIIETVNKWNSTGNTFTDADDVIELIGMTPDTDYNTTYVKNPILINNKINDDGTASYSYTNYYNKVLKKAAIKNTLGDSMAGYFKKWKQFEDTGITKIDKPLKQLGLTDITISGEVGGRLVDVVSGGSTTVNKYFDVLTNYIKTLQSDPSLASSSFRSSMDIVLDTLRELKSTIDFTNNPEVNEHILYKATLVALTGIEINIRDNEDFNNNFLQVLTKDPLDTSYEDAVNHRKEIQEIFHAKNNKRFIYGGNNKVSNKNTSIFLSKIQQDAATRDKIKYIRDTQVLHNADTATVAVCIDDMDAEDQIIWNNKSNLKLEKEYRLKIDNVNDEGVITPYEGYLGEELNEVLHTDLDPDQHYTIGKINRTKEGLIKSIQLAAPENSLENMKIHALSKAVAVGSNEFEDNADFDVVVSGAGFKNFEKYVQSLGRLTVDENIVRFKLPGQSTEKRFKIVRNVPIHVLIDDAEYDKTKTKNLEYMGILGNIDTAAGVGIGGSIAYEIKEGELYKDTSKLAPLVIKDNGTTINWSTAVVATQAIRANVIADAITHYNLWDSVSDVITNKNLRSSKEWLNDVSKNHNICTKEFNTMLNTLINIIGPDKFGEFLSKQSEQRKAVFSEDILQHLNKYIPGAMYAFKENGKQILLHSKNKSQEELRRFQPESPGEIYNATEKTLGESIRYAEDYYIPMEELYKAFGVYVDFDDIYDATGKGLLRHGKHSNGNLSNGFSPLNEIFKLQDNLNLSDNINNVDLKNGTQLSPTSKLYSRLFGMIYNESGEDASYLKDVFGTLDDPTLETALYDNLSSDKFTYDYDKSKTMLGTMLYAMYNRNNKSNFDVLREILGKNISSEIKLNVAKKIKTIQDGNITSTIKPITDEVDFNKLKSKELEELSTSLNTLGFYTFNEIENKLPTADKTKEEVSKAIDSRKANKEEVKKLKEKFKENLNKTLGIDKLKDTSIKDKGLDRAISFTFDAKPTYSPFKDSPISRSGIKITEADELQADTIIKNYASSVEMYKVESLNKFNTLKGLVNNKNKQLFEELCVYTSYKLAEKENPEHARAILKYVGVENIENYKKSVDTIMTKQPEIVRALNDFYESVKALAASAKETTGEEFGNLTQIIAPFVPANKELTKETIKGNLKRVGVIKSELNFNSYDPTNGVKSNMIFNFFESAPQMIDQLAKVTSMKEFSKGLINYGLIDNVEPTNKVYEFLNENINIEKLYTKKLDRDFYEIQNTVYDVVQYLTDIDVVGVIKRHSHPIAALKTLYSTVAANAEQLRISVMSEEGEVYSLSELHRLSIENPENVAYKKAFNAMRAQLICAQRLSEISPSIIENVQTYIEEVNKSGMALCNKFGQKISMDTPFKPIAQSSLKYLSDNIELYANNSDPNKFAQYIIEKAISGDLYIGNAKMIDHFDKTVYTRKVAGKLEKFFKDVSKASSSIQMALPAKLISRLLRFTGFDYIMGLTYSPKVAPEIIQAGKEISQAIYSKGASITEDSLLYQYLIREGQPIGQTGKDPITFSEDINKNIASITDKLTTPLQYQNHLGRYAIWLAAYKSFEKGDPWYGPVYHRKKEIDALGNTKEANYDKAMYIMDYMLGSPGGFPNISKSISGYLMYATFPLNLTRTMGAYGMSLLTLAQEGITAENAPHWMKSVVAPSASLITMNYLSTALIMAICDMYDIDEETEEEWIEEGVTIDPLGTLIGGTPSVVYDSLLPNKNLKEMYLNPLTSEYNETLTDKMDGLVNSTILSKLNPALKTPIEIISRKDLFGSSPVETKHKYTASENAMRKVLGFILGNGVSNSIIDQYKMDKYDSDATFLTSLKKGFVNGFSSDLGNQKTWKKDTSNYYSVLDSLRNFKNANGEQYTSSFNTSEDDYYSSDYARINAQIRKMIHAKVDATTLYAYIISEYNSTQDINTLRSVLNNNSVIRKLNTIDKEKYYSTLTEKELEKVMKAIRYEQEVYPFLETMFPYEEDYEYNRYLPRRNTYYGSGFGYGTGYVPSGKTVYPKFNYPNFNTYSSSYKSYRPKSAIDRVSVNVSPEMAVWKNDFNAIEDLDKKEWYLDNPFYNNLSDYEKRQRGGN